MLNSRAYTEAYCIINLLDNELKEKIPTNIMKNIEKRMNKYYEFNVDENNIDSVELLKDTEKLLSVIYTDYLATEEERKVILEAEEKIAKTNKKILPKVEINELFSKKQTDIEEHESLRKDESTNMEMMKLPKQEIFTKIWAKIKKYAFKIIKR